MKANMWWLLGGAVAGGLLVWWLKPASIGTSVSLPSMPSVSASSATTPVASAGASSSAWPWQAGAPTGV